MHIAFGVVLCGLVAYLSVPLWADLLAAARGGSRRSEETTSDAPSSPARILFLVPAHDEERLIGACVDSLLRVEHPAERLRIVVVADNCRDRTADLARERGADCLERHDPERRGKPHAIRWALERVGRDWDSLVIIDADTEVVPGFARAIQAAGPMDERVVQAHFAVRNPGETWLTRLSDLLNWATYRFRYPLKMRAGLNCPMTGNGMCIGRGVLDEHPWTTTSLTENWELYAQYTAAGVTIDYAEEAVLLSQEAKTLGQSRTQRRRWTAGRFGVLRRWWRRVLASESIGWPQKLDCIAELSSPSPVLQVAAVLAVGAVTPLAPDGWTLPLLAGAAATLVPLGTATARAFLIYPEKTAVLTALLRLPLYLAWRCWVLIATIVSPRDEWTRSRRHVEIEGGAP